jgi:predicted permease
MRKWLSRVLASLGFGARNPGTTAELRFHFEMEVEAGLRRGLSREEAQRQARLRAGSVATAEEYVRDQKGLPWLDGAILDLRHAFSALRRQPAYLLAVGGALTFTVAANTLMFTVVNGVLLRPLPYKSPERLVRIYEWSERNPKFPVSVLNYKEDRQHSRTLESLGLYTRSDLQLMHGDKPERITTVAVTDDFFPTLGVQPALGRNFLPSEMVRASRVVILSHTLWKTRFGSDPHIVGKPIRLSRENWTVIGVMPAGFQHVGGNFRSPLQGDTVGLWSPLGLDLPPNGQRNWHFTNAVARLRDGVTLKAAEQDLNRILDDLARRYPDSYGRVRARLEPLQGEVVGKSRVTVQLIMAAGLLVLVVACINVAGLCVARVLSRRRELAVRQALGGDRWRLMRAVLSENLLVGVAGGIAGLVLAAAVLPALGAILPADFPRLHEISFHWAAAAFALIAALLASLIAGLLPAIRQTACNPREGLSEGPRTATAGAGIRGLRGALVTGEVALACILCFGAALLLRSANALHARDHGFDSAGVLTFQITLPSAAYQEAAPMVAFYDEILRRWREIRGVRAAGFATNVPWTGYDENTSFSIPGRPAVPGESVQARYQAATSGFFEALRFRLLRGRFIEAHDHGNRAPVVVINESLSKRYFAHQDPLERELDVWGAKRRIVGVVADVRDKPADAAAEPAFWMSMAQQPFATVQAVIHADGDPAAMLASARSTLQSLDPELPIAEVQTMDDVTAVAVAERRFALWCCEAFAALGLGLAAIGVYGLLTYIVQQRRREIGIRLALGATRPGLLWMITSSGLRLALAGVAAGLLLAPVAGRALASLLFGVSATDPLTLITAPALLLLVVLLASLVPASIAARCEPASALREE